jgi:cytoskeletal protein RodZ
VRKYRLLIALLVLAILVGAGFFVVGIYLGSKQTPATVAKITPTPTAQASQSATITPTVPPTVSVTQTPTVTPTVTPTPTPTPSPTPFKFQGIFRQVATPTPTPTQAIQRMNTIQFK